MRSTRTRTMGRSAVVAAALLSMGCSDSPTEPASATPPLPGSWSLTSEVTAASGNLCTALPELGSVSHTTFHLLRVDNTITLSMDESVNRVSYGGFSNGRTFNAATSRAMPLRDPSCLFAVEDSWSWRFTLTGTFSEDFSRFSATEVWTFTYFAGEVVTRTFSWSANRI